VTPASIKRRRERLRLEHGARCCFCFSTQELEFSHIAPTGLFGEERGRYERMKDIDTHPYSYALMCKWCHAEYDGRGLREG
jgi:hypothetical protein